MEFIMTDSGADEGLYRGSAWRSRIRKAVSAHPIGVPLVLLGVAVIFRIVDIFVLRLDGLLSEIILSKLLGLLLVLGYVWFLGRSVASIGLHRRAIDKVVLIGGVGTAVVFVAAFGFQYLVLAGTDQTPGLVFVAIDPKTGLAGGVWFTASSASGTW